MAKLIRISYPNALSGSVEVHPHGDTTRDATIYSDSDCTTVLTDLTISADGIKEFYVKELVDITVLDADGETVAGPFTEGERAEAVEVASQSFTGTLSSGSQGVGGTVDLKTVLDLWYTSAKAPDFKVRRATATADESIQDALTAVQSTNSPFFNVVTYGAVGDGTTNDYVPITRAIAAAIAAGGGTVLFPAGSYLTSSAIVCASSKVSFLGHGAAASVITNGTAGNVCLTIIAGSATRDSQFIKHLGFDHSSTGTTYAIQAVTCPGLIIEGVRIRNHNAGINLQTPGIIRDCDLTAVNSPAILLSGSAAKSQVHGGFYAGGTGGVIDVDVTDVVIRDVEIDIASTPSIPTTYGIDVAAERCRVEGCRIFDSGAAGGGGNYPINITADVVFHEVGNLIDLDQFASHVQQGAATYTSIYRGSRLAYSSAPAAGASASVDADRYLHRLSANANWTFGAPTGQATHGAEMLLFLENTTGGAITVTWNAVFRTSAAAQANVAAGRVRAIRVMYDQSLGKWVQCGEVADIA